MFEGVYKKLCIIIKRALQVDKLIENKIIMSNTLYTFIAEDAIKNSDMFTLNCNCGGSVIIMSPFQEKEVTCPKCESIIKILVVSGDPGYLIGADENGEPKLLPVQGSKAPPIELLTESEKNKILENVKNKMKQG